MMQIRFLKQGNAALYVEEEVVNYVRVREYSSSIQAGKNKNTG